MKMYNGFLIPEHEKSDNGFECCMSAFTKKGCMNIMCKNCLFDEPRRNNLFYEWVTSGRPTSKDNKTMKQLREVLKDAYWIDKNGFKWSLYQDNDLFAVRSDYNFEDNF